MSNALKVTGLCNKWWMLMVTYSCWICIVETKKKKKLLFYTINGVGICFETVTAVMMWNFKLFVIGMLMHVRSIQALWKYTFFWGEVLHQNWSQFSTPICISYIPGLTVRHWQTCLLKCSCPLCWDSCVMYLKCFNFVHSLCLCFILSSWWRSLMSVRNFLEQLWHQAQGMPM
jgi:hypothetical protein